MRVGQFLELQRRVGLAQLLTLPKADRALEGEKQRTRLFRKALRRVAVLRPTGDVAGHVVVGKGPHRPAAAALEELSQLGAEEGGGVVIAHQLEAVALVQAAGGGVLAHHADGVVAFAHLAHAGRAVFVQKAADAFQPGQCLGLVLVEKVVLHPVGVGLDLALDAVVRGVVAELGVVEEVVDRVEAEAVDAAVQPEAEGGKRPVLDLGVVVVEVGLRGEEVVQVVLLAPRVPGPGGAAEDGKPVRGRGAVMAGVGPDVPVGLGIQPVAAAFGEERVLVRGVAEDLVDDDLEAQLMRPGDKGVEIGEGSEDRVDVLIVRDVVAHVLHRAAEEGGEPDRVDAEVGKMAEPPGDAGQVAHPVAIRVLEGPGIDLIGHRTSPPVLHRRLRLSRTRRVGDTHTLRSSSTARPVAAKGRCPGIRRPCGSSATSPEQSRDRIHHNSPFDAARARTHFPPPGPRRAPWPKPP